VILSEEEVDFVDMRVEAERSSLIDPVRALISKTVAQTSALLRDGEQTAIAGLYGQETTVTRSGIPLLKDFPPWLFGLRYLFGYNSRLVSKTELIVLLKVEIVPSVRERVQKELEEMELQSEFQGYEDFKKLRQRKNQRVF
jgi:type IV pilus assembly protein PilQ